MKSERYQLSYIEHRQTSIYQKKKHRQTGGCMGFNYLHAWRGGEVVGQRHFLTSGGTCQTEDMLKNLDAEGICLKIGRN